MEFTLPRWIMVGVLAATPASAAETNPAVVATNELGLDLYRQTAKGDSNLCLSPYSIQSALAMTFAGADGKTRAEMTEVLHYPAGDDAIHASFAALRKALEQTVARSIELSNQSEARGSHMDPISLEVANRLFGQAGYDFRSSFLALVKEQYDAPFDALDFSKNAGTATKRINEWVAEKTKDRIRNLISPGGLGPLTRLVLVNAVHLKAPWEDEFAANATKPEPFHIRGGTPSDVPMMIRHGHLGYTEGDGFAAVSIHCKGGDLQFLVLVPDQVNGLSAVESKITAATLANCTRQEPRDVILHLPKFKLEPPTLSLVPELETLGMRSAFDQPTGSADFGRMAPRKDNQYLFISNILHKTFISIDEKGMEAAAATAVSMGVRSARPNPEQPVEVRVDRPFLFAIQHVPTGTCLFLGRVTDPR
jgi:serine protease inhibitor